MRPFFAYTFSAYMRDATVFFQAAYTGKYFYFQNRIYATFQIPIFMDTLSVTLSPIESNLSYGPPYPFPLPP